MLFRSQTSRIFLLLGGNGLGQLITIAAMLFLSRLYDPADFGLLAGIVSVVSLSSVIVHGRYHLAIPVSRNENEAVALFALAVALCVVLAPVVVLAVVFLTGQVAAGINFLLFVGIAVAFTQASALIDVFTYWRSHRQRFKVSARSAVSRAGATAVAQIAMSPLAAIGLAGGALAGAAVALALSVHDAMRLDAQRPAWPPVSRMLAAARLYSGYPLLGMPQGLIAAISWNALPLLLLHFSGTEFVGQYWLAYRLLVAPLGLFGSAYRPAMLPVMGRGDQLAAVRMVQQHSIILLFLAGAFACIAYPFGEAIFSWLFGETWRQAGAIAGYLVIGIAADVVKIPSICLLQSRGAHRSILGWEAAIAAVRYGIALKFLSSGDAMTAIAVFSAVGFVGWMSFSIYCLFGKMKHEIVETKGGN
jgi:O-antigen/teichoic acid export membrane protein